MPKAEDYPEGAYKHQTPLLVKLVRLKKSIGNMYYLRMLFLKGNIRITGHPLLNILLNYFNKDSFDIITH